MEAEQAESYSREDSERLREVILRHGVTFDRAAALADALEGEGRYLGALRALQKAVRLRREPSCEKRLVYLRNAAVPELGRFRCRSHQLPQPDPEVRASLDSPRLSPERFTLEDVVAALHRYGFAWIPGLIPECRVNTLRERIDDAFEARERWNAGAREEEDYFPQNLPGDTGWKYAMGGGGRIFLGDAPRVLHDLLETFLEVGLIDLLDSYFGEPAILSAREKGEIRRVQADRAVSLAPWHQDGAFLPSKVRTLNAWTALSDCGFRAPGMDLLSVRPERVLALGEADTGFDWAVAPETIDRELPGAEIRRPQFCAGDVMLFDHLCVHRTAADPDMADTRYAVESWFFGASGFPEKYIPLTV